VSEKTRQTVFGPFTGEIIVQVIQKDRESRAKDDIIEQQRSMIKALMKKLNVPVKREYGKLRGYLNKTHLNILKIVDRTPGLTYDEIKKRYEREYHPISRVPPRVQELRASVKGWNRPLVVTVYDPEINRIRVYPKEGSS